MRGSLAEWLADFLGKEPGRLRELLEDSPEVCRNIVQWIQDLPPDGLSDADQDALARFCDELEGGQSGQGRARPQIKPEKGLISRSIVGPGI
jgi:hypothetical protein